MKYAILAFIFLMALAGCTSSGTLTPTANAADCWAQAAANAIGTLEPTVATEASVVSVLTGTLCNGGVSSTVSAKPYHIAKAAPAS